MKETVGTEYQRKYEQVIEIGNYTFVVNSFFLKEGVFTVDDVVRSMVLEKAKRTIEQH